MAARAAAFFMALCLIFYSPFLVRGRHFVAADFLYLTPLWYDGSTPHNQDLFDGALEFYPWDVFLNENLHRGHLPLWNPYNFCGYPLLADGQSGFLYPPRLLLHRLLAAASADDFDLLLHTFLAGFFMYLWARRLGLSEMAALLCGTAWMFNGHTMAWLEIGILHRPTALVPMALYSLERAATDRRWVAAAALCMAGLLTCGHLQPVLYALLLIVLVSAWRRLLLPLAASAALGAMLAAPLLLPTLASVRASQRPQISLDYLIATYRQFLVAAAAVLVAPESLGSPVSGFALRRIWAGGYWTYQELCLYVGVAPLLLAVAGACHRGTPRFLVGLAAVALVLPATPLYWVAYHLPGLDRVNATRSAIFVVVFAVTLLAGYGIQCGAEKRFLLMRIGGMLAAAWLTIVLCLQRVDTLAALRKLVAGQWVRLPDPTIFSSPQAFTEAARAAFESTYHWSSYAMLAPLVLLLAATAAQWTREQWRTGLLLAITAVDLMLFAARLNGTVADERIYPATAPIAFLQQHSVFDRVMGVGTVRPNSLLPMHLYDAAGYDSFYPAPAGLCMHFLRTGHCPQPDEMIQPQAFPITRYDSPLVSLMGVRWMVAYPGQTLSGMRLALPAPIPIYENPRVLPRTFLVGKSRVMSDDCQALRTLDSPAFDAGSELLLAGAAANSPPPTSRPGTAGITNYDNERVQVRVDAEAPCWLFLSDTWEAGWSADVDGQAAAVERADVMFRAVVVPSGKHLVTFRYQPSGWKMGWGIACVGAAAVALLLVI